MLTHPAVFCSPCPRGLPQRTEGQFRRTWEFVPGLFYRYFRERVDLGTSLSVKRGTQLQKRIAAKIETDAAIAAADLLYKLEHGEYTLSSGKRRKINNDTSKLLFAVRGGGGVSTALVAPLWFSMSCNSRDTCNKNEDRSLWLLAMCQLRSWYLRHHVPWRAA